MSYLMGEIQFLHVFFQGDYKLSGKFFIWTQLF